MPNTKLTAAAVTRLKPPATGQVDWFDTTFPAFGLRISAQGTRSYILMTRIHGKRVRLTLGRAKTTTDGPGLGLAEARRKAGEWLEQIAAGGDPRQDQLEAREARHQAQRNTFAVVAAEFINSYAERNTRPRTVLEYRRALLMEPGVVSWQDRPIGTITKRDVLAVLDGILARGAETGANRWLAYANKFFGWCADREIIATVPTDRVRKPTREEHAHRFLTDAEIPWVWRALDAVGPPFGPLFQICLLTGQRRTEIAALRWSEIHDLEGEAPFVDLPPDRTKNGRRHVVPLSPAVADIVRSRPRVVGSDFVFTVTGRTSVTGFSKAKAHVDAVIAAARAADGLPPLPPWVWHSLRHTVATGLHALGVPPHVIEATLNHVSGARGGIAGVYNHAEYLSERREALNLWASHVLTLVERPAAAASTPPLDPIRATDLVS